MRSEMRFLLVERDTVVRGKTYVEVVENLRDHWRLDAGKTVGEHVLKLVKSVEACRGVKIELPDADDETVCEAFVVHACAAGLMRRVLTRAEREEA